MPGYRAPPARESERVQVSEPSVQLHPIPLIAVAVRPEGNESTPLTMPLDARPPAFFTVRLYVRPLSPCVKLPVCAEKTTRSITGLTVVASLAVLLAVLSSPPPVTVALFVTVAAVLLPTL